MKSSNSGQVLRRAATPAGPTVQSSEISPVALYRQSQVGQNLSYVQSFGPGTKILPLVGRRNYSILSSVKIPASKASAKDSFSKNRSKLVSQSQDNKREERRSLCCPHQSRTSRQTLDWKNKVTCFSLYCSAFCACSVLATTLSP